VIRPGRPDLFCKPASWSRGSWHAANLSPAGAILQCQAQPSATPRSSRPTTTLSCRRRNSRSGPLRRQGNSEFLISLITCCGCDLGHSAAANSCVNRQACQDGVGVPPMSVRVIEGLEQRLAIPTIASIQPARVDRTALVRLVIGGPLTFAGIILLAWVLTFVLYLG
jgi:hypothetical protein